MSELATAAVTPETVPTDVAGPYFDDLAIGESFSCSTAVSLTSGMAAVHQAIVGDRLRIALDHRLSSALLGAGRQAVHPALVWDVSIGQSTIVTQRVVANLFYRGLVFHRLPRLGDTLETTTEVVGLRETSRRPDRAPAGLAVLRVRTIDQYRQPVLDYLRCAMLPLADGRPWTGREDDLDGFHASLEPPALRRALRPLNLGVLKAPPDDTAWTRRVVGGDVVSGAPELARLTLNIAAVHHDETVSGKRLVYGGHCIGIAASQAARTMPELVTILGWHACDHLAPVYEGDTLHSELSLERVDRVAGGTIAHLRSRVRATRASDSIDVLDWRFVGLLG